MGLIRADPPLAGAGGDGPAAVRLPARAPTLRILGAMAVNVRVPGPLRRLTAGSAHVEVEGATVGAALADLDAKYPGFHERLYDASGALRQFINVYVNDSDIRFGGGLDTPVADNDDISIIPAVAGG